MRQACMWRRYLSESSWRAVVCSYRSRRTATKTLAKTQSSSSEKDVCWEWRPLSHSNRACLPKAHESTHHIPLQDGRLQNNTSTIFKHFQRLGPVTPGSGYFFALLHTASQNMTSYSCVRRVCLRMSVAHSPLAMPSA